MNMISPRVAAGLLTLGFFAVGCTFSHENTSTGLPYWPPSLPNYSSPAALSWGQPAAAGYSVNPTVPQAAAWRDAASRWVGTPYREGGHDRRGIDCSGFSDALYREVAGRGLPRSAREQSLAGRSIEPNDIQPGDLLFFQTTGEPVSHVAVCVGGSDFAHASTSKGVMFSSLSDPYWAQNFIGARRMTP